MTQSENIQVIWWIENLSNSNNWKIIEMSWVTYMLVSIPIGCDSESKTI